MNNNDVIQALGSGKCALQGMKVNMQGVLEIVKQVKDLDIENADIKESLDTISDEINSKIRELIDEVDSVIY